MNIEKNPLTTQLDIGGIWHIGEFVGLSFCILAFVFSFRKSLGLLGTTLWAYILVSALYIIEYPALPYGLYNTAYQVTAAQVFIEALVIPIGVMLTLNRVWKLIPIVVAIEIICVWIFNKGLMTWSSFDTAFIAMCFPFVSPWLKVASLLTIATHHGSTALLILAAQFLGYSIHNKNLRKYWLLLIPVGFYLAHKHQLNPWFDSGERLRTYKRFMQFWWNQNLRMKLMGIGPGSFVWTSLMIDKYEPPLYLQLHSDWLQTIWELGIIGGGLVLGFFIRLIHKAWEKPQLLAAILGVGAFCVTYHPWRMFPSALISVLIICVICCAKSNTEKFCARFITNCNL